MLHSVLQPAGAGGGGEGAGPGGTGSTSAGGVGATTAKVALLLAGMGTLVLGGTLLATQGTPPAHSWSRASALKTHAPGHRASPSAIIDLDASTTTAPVPASNRAPRWGAAKAPRIDQERRDDLAAELALMRQARAAMGAGNASLALSVLDTHQKQFPQGVLAQERTVTRVQALCRVGRTAEARAVYQRLARGAPKSPHLAALRRACPGVD